MNWLKIYAQFCTAFALVALVLIVYYLIKLIDQSPL